MSCEIAIVCDEGGGGGATEVLAHERLGVTSDSATQSARLTIRDPDIVVVSPADNEGES